ncbi:hypothetical protein ASG81_13785 [Paenibacillus sp. Soil522]|nr:hypothetical protein ASG81_13785 [Paenibacillus sp. Soil522]
MMGLPTPEVVSITSVDNFGNENDPNVKDRLVQVYSKGGGPGQAKYGVIKEWNHTRMQMLLPNENDPNVKDRLVQVYSKGGGPGQAKYGVIKEWNHTYYNGATPKPKNMGKLKPLTLT